MSYRDDLDAAHARIAALEDELARLRGDAPVVPRKGGVLDDLATGFEQLGREVGDLVSRATAKLAALDKSSTHVDADADAARVAGALAALSAADRALVEQIVTVLRTEADPPTRAAKVRALIHPGA